MRETTVTIEGDDCSPYRKTASGRWIPRGEEDDSDAYLLHGAWHRVLDALAARERAFVIEERLKFEALAELDEANARLAARERELADARAVFTRLAQETLGLTTPLELVARAESDAESYADILARMLHERVASLRADLAAVEAVERFRKRDDAGILVTNEDVSAWDDASGKLVEAPTIVALGHQLLKREAPSR